MLGVSFVRRPLACFCYLTLIQDVVCSINLQHRCAISACDQTGSRAIRQERELTTLTTAITKHGDSTHYLVNTNSMTNYEHIRCLVEAHSQLPLLILNPNDYPAIRKAATVRLALETEKKTKKRKRNRGQSYFWYQVSATNQIIIHRA